MMTDAMTARQTKLIDLGKTNPRIQCSVCGGLAPYQYYSSPTETSRRAVADGEGHQGGHGGTQIAEERRGCVSSRRRSARPISAGYQDGRHLT